MINKIIDNFKKINKINRKKGMTLVIAVMTLTLLLSISLSISNIVLRQMKISSVNISSKSAFFAADSALDCAFYVDTMSILDDTDPNDVIDLNKDFDKAVFGGMEKNLAESYIKCGESFITNLNKDTTNPIKTISNFDIDYGKSCAKVTIEKDEINTRILTRGYNTTISIDGSCDLSDINTKRLVERGLTIRY